jgi:glutathione synthase/RimK-type ligase-like ATP-grasp enzyme
MDVNNNNFFKIIDELCNEKNINQKKLSFGWIRELKKENKVRNIVRYTFDLNTAAFFNIACDKYATYEVLSNNNIPMIPHMMVFNPKTKANYVDENILKKIDEVFKKYNEKIVIKANNSSQGKDVFYCHNHKEIKNIIEKLFNEGNDSVSVCPYLDIEYEYRTIFLDGNIEFVYKKQKPYVLGNGINTVNELIQKLPNHKFNYAFYEDLDLGYIPKENEIVEISWKHNLSSGAIPLLIDKDDKYIKQVEEIAKNAGNTINAEFASIDISQTKQGEILVMEVNASVCMNKFSEIIPGGYEIAKKIYGKAIDKMFK